MGTIVTTGTSPTSSGVCVVDNSAAILEALAAGPCALGSLAATTDIPRATAHRIAVALEFHGLVERDVAGRFVLGERIVALARAAGPRSRALAESALPVLRTLRDRTEESTQLYVPSASGGKRICVVSLESPHSLRTIVEVGDSLPMDRGSAAAALKGAVGDGRGWVASVEERELGVASVSAPVRAGGRIVAAISVSGPLERTTVQPGRRYGDAVADAAMVLEAGLAAASS